ncbi:hypothetical protein MIMGU_mgv1a019446mg [Erythranthe guttata]|uniref:TPX2 central domain-containing protein n=1 Tax=Erythranthe guttata TaxID=4155 RepID=A0A022RF99_ERYGU|nr:hypothetical protein MIMGU_mgv1a019446mg [Erythranthe guttata]
MVEDAMNEEEEEEEYTFTAYEIDLDYEFDAARFFDFSRAESPLEARHAEIWFDSAGSYPPSPFVARLREELLMGNINISPKSKGVESMNLSQSDSDAEYYSAFEQQDKGTSSTVHIGSQQYFQNHQKLPSGLTFYNHMVNNVKSENQAKLSSKPSFPRTSTLMKPTASQLAKQNRPFQAGYSRSHVPVLDKSSKSSTSTCVIENQAAKRQKLDGGLLRKVATVQLQQPNFVHKAPKRDGLLDGTTSHTKPRITIPRDPQLETTHRAQRTRENNKDENVTSNLRRFKALPLNRKILEAPSLVPKRSTPRLPDFQEFHLKTTQRALQHSSAVLKSTVPSGYSDKELHKVTTNLTTDCGNREPGRPSIMSNASNPDGCQQSHRFKALPLNQKILTSKGAIGIFRNSKKETTVPMVLEFDFSFRIFHYFAKNHITKIVYPTSQEFNFQTDKRNHINPPIELFNKLSLASETQPVANSASRVPWSISTTPAKVSTRAIQFSY